MRLSASESVERGSVACGRQNPDIQLAPHMHLVGSGSGGFDLTNRYDCHVYLLDGATEAALIDAGIGVSADAILEHAARAGIEREKIRYCLLTHAHPDHTGGVAALAGRLPWLEVVASPLVAEWVRAGDERAMSVEIGKKAEFYPPDFRFQPAGVGIEVGEGDRIRVGTFELEVIETPGHSDGHLSYAVEIDGNQALFCGDLLFYGGLVSLENTWDCRIQDYAASVAKIASAAVEMLLPGHHSLTLRGGQRHIERAHHLFEHGFVPKSVV